MDKGQKGFAKARRNLELLVQTGLLLTQEPDLHCVVQAATDAGLELSGAQFGAFFYNVTNSAGESYLLYALSGAFKEKFANFPMPRKSAVFAPTFEGVGVVRSGDITKDRRYGQSAPHYGMPNGHPPVRSYLAIPVKGRSGEVLGGLFYGHADMDVFEQETEDLVGTVAAQAAIAIENLRLNEQLTRKIEEVGLAQAREHKGAQRVIEVLESTSDAVFLLDHDWRFTFLNQHAARLIAEGRQLLGAIIWEVLPGAVDSAFYRNCHDAMERRQKHEFVEYYAPLGLWLSVQAYPADEGIAIFFRDVTKMREDARLQEENAHRLRLALDAGRLGTWSWNIETDMLDLDERAAEIFLWKPHVPVSRDLLRDRIVAIDDRKGTVRALRNSLEGLGTYNSVYRIVHDDGSFAWVRSLGIPIFDESNPGKPVGMIGMVQDITDLKQQEETLKRTEMLAATGRLAATIAHEINNPLEAVTNLIFLAKTNKGIPPAVEKQLEAADQELARVAHIAQQTLGFYRDTSQAACVDLAGLINDLVTLFQRKLLYKRLQCRVEMEGRLEVSGLPGELRQAVSNLLVNAIDASPPHSSILIRAKASGAKSARVSFVKILVCDQGSGIPASVRKQLFQPFFTTKKSIGTGLGLWVTKGIIEKHQGKISFRSRTNAPSGSIFRIVLPRGNAVTVAGRIQ